MAQDAIILYENGKAIGGEGHPTNASDITFDNTGTDLVSENVESAIKEVNAKTQHGLVEIWKNPNPTASFAGQTLNVATSREYDSFMYEFGDGSSEQTSRSFMMGESTKRAVSKDVRYGAQGQIYFDVRAVTPSRTSTGYSFVITDSTTTTVASGSISIITDNTKIVPFRILGLIHND